MNLKDLCKTRLSNRGKMTRARIGHKPHVNYGIAMLMQVDHPQGCQQLPWREQRKIGRIMQLGRGQRRH